LQCAAVGEVDGSAEYTAEAELQGVEVLGADGQRAGAVVFGEDVEVVYLELRLDKPIISEGEFLAEFEAATEVDVAVAGFELSAAVGGFQVVVDTGGFEGGVDVEAAAVKPGGVEAAVITVDFTVSAGGAVVEVAAAVAGVYAEV
jgi:hypothetical protein